MSYLHGQVIDFNSINDKFINRTDLLNKQLVDEDFDKVNNNQDILVYFNDFNEFHMFTREGYQQFYLQIAGITPSGLKTVVSIKYDPYFLLRVPDQYIGLDVLDDKSDISLANIDDKLSMFESKCLSILEQNNIKYSDNWKFERYYRQVGFQINKGVYLKMTFYSIFDRKKAIELLSKQCCTMRRKQPQTILGFQCESAFDDLTCYYRVILREFRLNSCGWNLIRNYKVSCVQNAGYHLLLRKYRFNGNILLTCQINDILAYNEVDNRTIIRYDNSIEASWDIECNRWANDGEIPNPKVDKDEVFMIGVTFAFYHTKESLLRVCITSRPTSILENDLTIQCQNERELCLAFAQIMGKVQPEFIAGFNDSDFDWNFVMIKSHKYLILEEYKQYMSVLYNETYISKREKEQLITSLKREPNSVDCLQFINDKIIGNGMRAMNFEKQMVKLDAETSVDGYMFRVFGYIPIDVRTMFRAIEKNPESSSLNYFLTDNKLENKEDLPIVELFAIYNRMQKAIEEENTENISIEADNMAKAKSYCITDAESCHRLLHKRNVIMDQRNVSEIAYTSLHDAVYRADGMKVCNYVIADAQTRGIAYSNINQPKYTDDKYPGAYVKPPEKGMQCSKLTIKERVEAAKQGVKYPYYTENKSYSQWLSVDDEQIEEYHQLVDQYWDCPNEVNNPMIKDFLKEKTGRPVSGIDFSSLYPSIIMAYNMSPERLILHQTDDPDSDRILHETAKRVESMGYQTHHIKFTMGEGHTKREIEGYSVRHTYDPDLASDQHTPENQGFGIFPTILHYLFTKRKSIKKVMNKANHYLEETDRKIAQLRDEGKMEEADCILQSDEYNDNLFNSSYYNSKQLALKVFMNTFYGVTGNAISPLYNIVLAGGVTSGGQYNIKLTMDYLQSIKCEVVYGDTDSAYIICPVDIYNDIDRKYYTGKMSKNDYWTEMVELTFKKIDEINNQVNTMLRLDNGTKFLKTAYEEVLYPVAFLAKKKYYGIPHEGLVNFHPQKLFIRGLELKKRGVSQILKKICSDIMWASVSMNELRPLRHLVEDAINTVYTSKWEADDFIRTGSYKPNKQNVAIHRFVERMKDERNIIIQPVERFSYVFVKKYPYRWDAKGRSGGYELKNGDVMELVDIAVKEKMEIDLDKYVSGSLVGQFARLIAYHEEFQKQAKGPDDDYKIATNEVEQLCKTYQTKYVNHAPSIKKVYKRVNDKFNQRYQNTSLNVPNAKCLVLLDKESENLNELIEKIYEEVKTKTVKESVKYAAQLYKGLKYVPKMESIDYIISLYSRQIEEQRLVIQKYLDTHPELFNIKWNMVKKIMLEFNTILDRNIKYEDDDAASQIEQYCNNSDQLFDCSIDDVIQYISDHYDEIETLNSYITNLQSIIKLHLIYNEFKIYIKNEAVKGTASVPAEVPLFKNGQVDFMKLLNNIDDNNFLNEADMIDMPLL